MLGVLGDVGGCWGLLGEVNFIPWNFHPSPGVKEKSLNSSWPWEIVQISLKLCWLREQGKHCVYYKTVYFFPQ